MPERIELVTLRIAGREFKAWESISIGRHLDEFTTVGFSAPFDPERRDFRDTFRPFSFQPVTVDVGDERVFTGTLMGVDPDPSPEGRSVRCSAYAKCAHLNDCTMPPSAFPLELNGLTLWQIAEKVCEPFGIDLVIEANDGAPFRRVALKPDDIVLRFLADLAKQRNLVISDNAAGGLVFLRSVWVGEEAPVATLREGEAPLTSLTPTLNPQAYFTEITGVAKTRSGRLGGRFTIKNPFAPEGVFRPLTFELDDTDDADVPEATQAKLGRMFGNALSLSAKVPTWRMPGAALWRPNVLVTLEAPSSMIYRPTPFLVRDVILEKEEDEQTAQLELVLPGAFSGAPPSELPWLE